MRRRVYDANDIAVNIRRTFADREVEWEEELPYSWPVLMQHVGDSLGVAYGSDKWKPKSASGRREIELYKHVAESHNRILVVPGEFRDAHEPSDRWRLHGPVVSLARVPMPRHFAILGFFKEANLWLHGPNGKLGGQDDGIVTVTVAHGFLGASKILWSKTRDRQDQPFLFVYNDEGVKFIIVGDKLDVERDGIVG